MKVYFIARREIMEVADDLGRRMIEQGQAIYMPPQKAEETTKAKPKKAKRGAKTYEPEKQSRP